MPRIFIGIIVFLLLVGAAIAMLHIKAADGDAITLMASSDTNGEVTEWMLKGDANHDGEASGKDIILARQILSEVYAPSALEFEAADLNGNTRIDAADLLSIRGLANSAEELPIEKAFFRVVDKPDTRYEVASVKISNGTSAIFNLPASAKGTYTLGYNGETYTILVADDGTATVTGPSLAVNKVQFTHRFADSMSAKKSIEVSKKISGDTPEAAETFTFNIAANEKTLSAPIPTNTTCTVTGAGTASFDEITYAETGRYYYDITETAGDNTNYSYDTDKYIVLVEVVNDTETGGLKIGSTTIWRNKIVNEASAKLDKVEFTNTYTAPAPGTLNISKTVTGELADLTRSFSFTVTLSDTSYNFDAGRKGKIENGTGTLTLKNGESVTLTGLAKNTTYTIVEDEEVEDSGYKTTIDNNGTAVTGRKAGGTIGEGAAIAVAYTNNLPYIPVVGLNMTSMPFILLGLLGVAMLGLIFIRKSRANRHG